MQRLDGQRGPVRKGRGAKAPPPEPGFKTSLCFWCLNPGVVFGPMAAKARSVILTSGTLSPMATFQSELDTPFALRVETAHVIEPGQVWVGSISAPTRDGPAFRSVYDNMERVEYQDQVGHAIESLVAHLPHGMLVFLPSYHVLEKFRARWEDTGVMDTIRARKRVFVEPRSGGKGQFDTMLRSYYATVDAAVAADGSDAAAEPGGEGALLLGVYRGKISEGIDFAHHYARAVVIIGIPYPNLYASPSPPHPRAHTARAQNRPADQDEEGVQHQGEHAQGEAPAQRRRLVRASLPAPAPLSVRAQVRDPGVPRREPEPGPVHPQPQRLGRHPPAGRALPGPARLRPAVAVGAAAHHALGRLGRGPALPRPLRKGRARARGRSHREGAGRCRRGELVVLAWVRTCIYMPIYSQDAPLEM